MKIVHIEVEGGRDDLPSTTVEIGPSLHVNLELLRPRWSRWHWWNTSRPYHGVYGRVVMCPVAAVNVQWWGEERTG